MNFLDRIEKFESNLCLFSENKEYFSFKDILNKGESLNKNLQSGSLVFVLAENEIDFVSSYISFFKKGIAQMLLNPKIPNDFLNELIIKYMPNYILLPNSRKNELKNYKVLNESNNYQLIELNRDKPYSINKDLALLLGTSGSTGSMKFVRISHQNVYHNTEDIVNCLKIDESHRSITTMPPFYTYGLSVINTHLFTGASILVTKVKAVEFFFWQLMKDEKICSFAGVPFFYEVLNKIKFNNINLPYLKYFTQAGGALKKDLIEYFLKYSLKNKKKFIIMYGQTEATARIAYLPFEMLEKKIGSVGIPIGKGKIYLQNDDNKKDKKGEIIFEGKNVSLGYAESFKDLIKGDHNNKKLRTGDIGIKDNDGYLYITGRKSRDIKLFGHRVSLDEVEKILLKKGYDCKCCMFDNKVAIFHTDKTYNGEILKYISNKTNIYLNCFILKYIKKFPTNENGKTSYEKLESIL
tara:strand:- start:466 stop:1863 length:1398 start_codon:yes stop_codon:yes gene_type:complete